jgi:hypothetical protein
VATHRLSILGAEIPDTGVPLDAVANQIAAATSPSVGDLLAYVFGAGADEGLKGSFKVPKNYVGSPVIVVTGILDGAPGASDTLQVSWRKRAVAQNEAADGTFDAEQTGTQKTIGSSGDNFSDEDLIEMLISATAGDFAVDDQVYFHVYLDDGSSSYAGNFLVTDIEFQYADA